MKDSLPLVPLYPDRSFFPFLLWLPLTFGLITSLKAQQLSDVPQWAREAVWYQIFPERFRNGDPSNDPTVNDIQGSWPHETPGEWHVSSWTADWYKLQPWETIDPKDASQDRGFYYRVQQRRYGGDLQGVIDKLDYLKNLGINAIYFNPLFESPSLHKYDAAMYHHIDNNFGPDPEGDRKLWANEDPANPATWKWTSADRLFLKLIDETHKRGMHVIIDGVFNHVGQTFWAFVDVLNRGEASPYKDWFTIRRFDDPNTPEDEFNYEGWNGVRELPEVRRDENGLAPGPSRHVHDVVKRWMDPNGDGNPSDGIDGWRLDVAEKVPIPFWRQFRTWVRGVNPNAYITGEVWWEDWAGDKMYNAAPWLQGDVFDAVMNYRWAREVCHFFIDDKNKITASEFNKRLAALRDDYRSEANDVLMNLLDSHDTDRLSSHIINVDASFDKHVGLNDNHDYDIQKPNDKQIRVQKLMALFQMTYVGAPMVYYGDEAGMWGADDPDCRKPMLWADMTYENEAIHPFGASRPSDRNEVNADLLAYYKKLIGIRRSHPALSTGSFTTLGFDDRKDVLAFLRSSGKENIVVIVNNLDKEQRFEIPLPYGVRPMLWRNLMDGRDIFSSSGRIVITVAGKSGEILRGIGP